MNIQKKVNFFFEDIEQFEFNKEKYREWVVRIIKSEGSVPGFLNIVFVSDEYLLDLNKKHLSHDYYTDVISFGYSFEEYDNICGDIFISIESIKENAKEYDESFKNELLRVIAHGVLHLLGYDDKKPELKKVMQEKENIYINSF